MINLLPPEQKEAIHFARLNMRLVHWSIAMGISLVLAVVIVGAGQIYLNQSIKDNKKQLAQTQEQLKLQKLEDTQKRVEDISGSIKLVVQVLSKEVLFSNLLRQIGTVMPPNTALTGLSINKLQGGLDLQAEAADYAAATQIQLNLSDPNNQIFSNADIVTISCDSESSTSSNTAPSATTDSQENSDYPCSVSIRAQFASNNPFLFINNTATGSKQ